MNDDARLERIFSDALAVAAPSRAPDRLRTHINTAVSQTRPRPRWLALVKEPPMRLSSRVAVGSPTFRLVAIMVVTMALILAAAAAVVVGASPQPSSVHSVLAPYGPARNGSMAYDVTGDIYLADATGDHAVPIVAGPTSDLYPGFLRDGTKLAFLRTENDTTLTLMVARADGTAPVSLATKVDAADDAPDGATMVVLQTIDGHPAISIVATDGTAKRTLDLGGIEPAGWVDWRPTDGRELIFTGHPHAGTLDLGLYAIRADGTGLRQIGAISTTESDPSGSAPTQLSFQNSNPSPDGSTFWYTNWEPNDTGTPDDSIHVRDLTTGQDRRVRFNPQDPQDTQALLWALSPDGTSVLYESRGSLYIAPVDGSQPGRAIGPAFIYQNRVGTGFSPDGKKVYLTLSSPAGTSIIDVASGAVDATIATIPTQPSWQRLAP